MKVAAYCRVSTDNDDQINSLENQTSFFREYIRKNPEWEFVEIYADEGVTGTSVAGRTQFSRMIEDAVRGRIDLILTKEVSRFARNTVDALHYTRQLRRLGVGVFFIGDNISTLDGDGELRLSLMSMLAQEESRKTSARVRWGMRRQMERGFVFSPPMLGYENTDGVLTVNCEEAEVVRRIFDMYVRQRMGSKRIAQTLAAENTPLYKRLKCWSPTAVMRILTNEKYAGDLIQQKTRVEDYLTHKSVVNREEKIVFRDHHEAIIDRAAWEEAQRIRQSRRIGTVSRTPVSRSGKYWCSGKIECGICRGSCVTKTKKAQYGMIRVYRCKHTGGGENRACTNQTYIDERILCACMQFVIRKLPIRTEDIRGQLLGMLNRSGEREGLRNSIGALEKQVEERNGKKKKMLNLLLEEVIAKEDYQAAAREADMEILELHRRIESLRQTENGSDRSAAEISRIMEHVRKYIGQEEVTKPLYSEILRKIVLYADNHVDIYLHGRDLPFSVAYARQGRGTQYRVFCRDYEQEAEKTF